MPLILQLNVGVAVNLSVFISLFIPLRMHNLTMFKLNILYEFGILGKFSFSIHQIFLAMLV